MNRKCKIFILTVLVSLLCAACSGGFSVIVVTHTPTHTPTALATKTPLPSSTPTITASPTITTTPTPIVLSTIYGLDLGPYILEGQNPDKGTILTKEQIEKEIAYIAPYTQWVRSYGCSGLEQLVPIAHQYGLNVAMGAWLTGNSESNFKEIQCLIDSARKYRPELLIVGSETLYRKDLTAAKLIEYMKTVKDALPAASVTTADTYGSILANPAVIEASDVVMVNIYPYWEGVSIENALAWLNKRYQDVYSASNGKEVWISETGWPDQGNTIKKAIPSAENASTYFLNFISWAKANEIRYFYFEAFDEPWKFSGDSPQEGYWGIWTNEYLLKPKMQAVFNGDTIADNWSPTATPNFLVLPTRSVSSATPSGPASIQFTYVPSSGSSDGVVRGNVTNADPSRYAVAVYIMVNDQWWTKPTFDWPLTRIGSDGTWSCIFMTGGNDFNATKIAAFLIPQGVSPSRAEGSESLPGDMMVYPYTIADR